MEDTLTDYPLPEDEIIFSTDISDLSDDDLNELAKSLTPDIIAPSSQDLDKKVREDFNAILPEIQKDNWWGTVKNMRDSVLELNKKKQLFALKVNGKAVGITGFKILGKLPDGRKVYEICKTAVLQRYQGNGYYWLLSESINKEIQRTDAKAVILIYTKHPAILQRAENHGWVYYHEEKDDPVCLFMRERGRSQGWLDAGYVILYTEQ